MVFPLGDQKDSRTVRFSDLPREQTAIATKNTHSTLFERTENQTADGQPDA